MKYLYFKLIEMHTSFYHAANKEYIDNEPWVYFI